MRHVSKFKPGAGEGRLPKRDVSSEAAKILNELFEELKTIKPAWRQSFPDERALRLAKREWTKAFLENGVVSLAQVACGKRRAREDLSPFFPSSGQFVAWCKPDLEDLGLPGVEAAFREACCAGPDHVWSHVAVLVAARESGQFELRSRARRETFALFERNYEVVCRRVAEGEALDVPIPAALPVEVSVPACRETVSGCLGEINSILGRGDG